TGTTKIVSTRIPKSLRLTRGNVHRGVGRSVKVRMTGPDPSRNRNRTLDLIGHLLASSGVQVSSVPLNDVERSPAHQTQHAIHLEPSQNPAGDPVVEPSLPLAKRHVPHTVRLEVVCAVVACRSAIPIGRGHELYSRVRIVVGEVYRL